MREAMFYEVLENRAVTFRLCAFNCVIHQRLIEKSFNQINY